VSDTSFRLLIADDEYWVRENLMHVLDWRDLMIEPLDPAVDGEDALRKVESGRPDILITDINMPFVSGNDLIRSVKQRYPQTAVIVLSGYNDFAFVRDALVCGAVDYLLKPVSKSALLEALEKAIAALGNLRVRQAAEVELNEKLLSASSFLRDRELSALIAEEETKPASEGLVSELELSYAAFRLVVIKMTRLASSSRKPDTDDPRRAREIKNLVARTAAGSLVFHNVHARNEFVVIANPREDGVARLCRELPGLLERHTGCRSNVAVSSSYFSFAQLRAAYWEARSALMACPFQGESTAMRAEGARTRSLRRRMTPEQENRLVYALQSSNRTLAREVIFDQIGLRLCSSDHWPLAEVKETVEYLAAVIFHNAAADAASVLALENFTYLLDEALESQDANEMWSIVEQALEEALPDAGGSGTSESMTAVVRRVQAYIDEKYFRDLSLTSLAGLFRVDRSYLSRAFKQVTGMNVMLAIAKKRIEKAQEYIRARDPYSGRELSLADISSLVGYEEYAYFNRVFRKITGVSPREYKSTIEAGKR
jgi:YesN/AraC family two-component response regulator